MFVDKELPENILKFKNSLKEILSSCDIDGNYDVYFVKNHNEDSVFLEFTHIFSDEIVIAIKDFSVDTYSAWEQDEIEDIFVLRSRIAAYEDALSEMKQELETRLGEVSE